MLFPISELRNHLTGDVFIQLDEKDANIDLAHEVRKMSEGEKGQFHVSFMIDYDKDLIASYKAGSDILDAPSSGLVPFFKKGGKLLLSHGWSDGLIPARNTADFYKSMIAKMDQSMTVPV